ncbi:MAG: chromate transporter [Spirochaetaceae bacterium]|jgi:chromate transporter|nr:chromate transporter [Spirochaetaceae bacterium]
MTEWIDLIWTFIKIGVSTFGGGYAMVPVLERELIKKKGWITMTEVMDYYTIAQVSPGIIAVNISTFVGYKRRGIPGSIAATVAFILPGILFMTAISLFIGRFAGYAAVQHAFAGIRVAVGALILDTIRKLIVELFKKERIPDTGEGVPGAGSPGKNPPVRRRPHRRAWRHVFTACIFAAAFLLSVLLSPSPVWIVAGAALAGFVFFRTGEKTARTDRDGEKP